MHATLESTDYLAEMFILCFLKGQTSSISEIAVVSYNTRFLLGLECEHPDRVSRDPDKGFKAVVIEMINIL